MNYKRKIIKLDFMKFKHIVSSLYIAENKKTSHGVGKNIDMYLTKGLYL